MQPAWGGSLGNVQPVAFGLLLRRSLASGGSLGREPLERAPVHCSLKAEPLEATSVCTFFFRALKVTSRRPQTLPSALGL